MAVGVDRGVLVCERAATSEESRSDVTLGLEATDHHPASRSAVVVQVDSAPRVLIRLDMAEPAFEDQNCGDCRFFRYLSGNRECHRYPPTLPGGEWPPVTAFEWCGEWKALPAPTDPTVES